MPIELGSFSLGTVAGGVVVGIFNHFMTKSRNAEERKTKEFNCAATKFRGLVINELHGFHPISQHWVKTEFPRLFETIPKIKSAAADFSFFVERENDFDIAVKEYDEYCRHQTWNDYLAWESYPSMRKKGDLGPRIKFDHIVNHLLSFAENK